jgi:tetratricopeptide (TPR) repeat protein
MLKQVLFVFSAFSAVLLLPVCNPLCAEGEHTEPEEEKAAVEEEAPEETIYDIRQRIESAEKERYELLRSLAYIYVTTGENDEAIEMHRKALEIDPSDRELIESLLRLYREGQRWNDMVPIYERFLEQYEGENETYYRELLDIYLQTGQMEKAFVLLDKYLVQHGGNRETYTYVANVFVEAGEKERAVKTLQTGLEKFPDNFDLNRRAANLYVEFEEYSKALEHFEVARKLASSTTAKETIEREMMALYKKADIVMEIIARKTGELEEVDLQLRELYSKQGETKMKAGKWIDAIESFRNLAALAPGTVEAKMASRKIKELESKLEDR